ncbi:MAG TPA: protease pro-enzyme activation domain-containing protein, partial [Acidimicrobiales bacterium]|nr:protease pro-enzyme activation domain-containing protein [Acidimicrobiales bacterium]
MASSRRVGIAFGIRIAAAATIMVLGVISFVVTPASASGFVPAFVRPNALAPGNAPSGANPLGSVPGSQQLQLSVVLPPSNGPQLQTLLRNLNDPTSPEYHHWLRPGQFAAEFGPSSAEAASVESWLHGTGLNQTTVSGFAVKVSAAASQVSTALGTSFEQYRAPSGHVGYLAQATPLVPQSLAGGQITAILGLDTVAQFQPQSTPAPASSGGGGTLLQPNADGLTPCAAAQSAAGSSYYTLDALGAAYGIGSLLADGQNGHGETIGVYELASHSATDVATYESCFGLTNPVGTIQVDGGGGTVGGNGTFEADLDIEQAATQAPGATIISYEGPSSGTGPYDTWNAIVSADAAQVVSTSWGEC